MELLERLLRPRSIAVIGGGTWCENVIRECRKTGFEGKLWAVHPKRDAVGGCPAYRCLAALPEAPDAAFLGINRNLTVEVVGQLSKAGAGGAVCFASGFREASSELSDGADLQSALVDAAGAMPILGPNCYGFINALDGAVLWPDQHGLAPASSGVAIISQSSNIALNLTMQTRGVPIAYMVTVGNQAQTGLSRLGEALLEDDRVTAIGLYIEGLDSLAAFERFARKARAAGKPVVVLKSGKTDLAQTAAISHTASLAGSTAGATALFNRLGVAQVESLSVLLETLKLFHVAGALSNTKIVSMSCSGGEAGLIADMAQGRRVSFPPLNDSQSAGLREVLGPKVALANPLDYHTYIWGNKDALFLTFAAMMKGDVSLGIVVLDFPRADRCLQDDWFTVVEAIETAMRVSGRPIAVLSSLPETMPEGIAADLIARKILPMSGMSEALAAIEASAAAGEEINTAPVFLPTTVEHGRLLDEHQAKERLKQYGVQVPRGVIASSAAAASVEADKIGYPVVLKGVGLAHKTEAGAVALNLTNANAVLEAADRIPTDQFFVEQMIGGTVAELLIGIVRDPAHGYVLTLAAGGVLSELLKDRVPLIVPASRLEIERALASLQISHLLRGYRGGVAVDLEKIIDAVLALQAYAMAEPVEEVEINPLMCGVDFAIAADALVICGEVNDG